MQTHTQQATSSQPAGMRLAGAVQGHSYRIVSNLAEGRNRVRMDALGLMPGDMVHVLFKNFSGLIVAVKGSRLALGRALAGKLTVEKLGPEDRNGAKLEPPVGPEGTGGA